MNLLTCKMSPRNMITTMSMENTMTMETIMGMESIIWKGNMVYMKCTTMSMNITEVQVGSIFHLCLQITKV